MEQLLEVIRRLLLFCVWALTIIFVPGALIALRQELGAAIAASLAIVFIALVISKSINWIFFQNRDH
jgi:cell division protein FtsW (lipid II flippase)